MARLSFEARLERSLRSLVAPSGTIWSSPARWVFGTVTLVVFIALWNAIDLPRRPDLDEWAASLIPWIVLMGGIVILCKTRPPQDQ